MINLIVLIIIIFYFLIASIEDFKKREVYDYINYSLTIFIIIIGIFNSIINNSINPIKYVGFGLLIGFFLGSILYYLGIWGGGDAKFLIGFSASSYYLVNFINLNTNYELIYNYLIEKFKIIFQLSMQLFFKYIMYLDIIFIMISLLYLIYAIKKLNKDWIKNLSFLNSILLFLFTGIYLDFNSLSLILIGFVSFLLIFFADDNLFNSVYIKIKKMVMELKVGDILDKNIIFNKKKLINKNNLNYGIDKSDLNLIQNSLPKNKELYVRIIIPYSMLIGLNFILYILKIINLDDENILILGFLIKFLVISFLVGGIITIFILIYIGIKNYKKIKIKFSLIEKKIIYSLLILIGLISLINYRFAILFFLILVYFIFKISKEIEKISFIKKKKISKIVPGDWIVEDIIINNKIVYSAEDFKLGVNEIQLEKINSYAKKRKINEIYVKDGIAFLPPLFIGFLILLLI